MSDPSDGACRVHAELPAIAQCPSCGAPACPLCWHAAAARCSACLAREPGGDAPEIAWEESGGTVAGRFVRTLLGTFTPARTAPSFGRRRPLGPAVQFAALSTLPAVLCASAIEYTFTFALGHAGAFSWVGHPTSRDVAVDVARACAIGVLLWGIRLLALAVPFVSLCRAYGADGRGAAPATRAMLYRVWVVPGLYLAALLFSWPLPRSADAVVSLVDEAAKALPLLLLAVTMRGVARDSAGVGPWASWVVVLIALAAGMTAYALADSVATPYIPHVEEALQGAASANGTPG